TEKFATYHRDSTNLDYADQRYYTSAWGRFLTADPYRASGGAADPQSWNRYAYTRGDPVNRYDPRGLQDETPTFSVTGYCYGCFGLPPGLAAGLGGDWGMPLPEEPNPEYVGGGGGPSRPFGYRLTVDLLAKKDCADLFGFSTGEAAVAAFEKTPIVYVDLGMIEVETLPGGTRVRPSTPGNPNPPPAQEIAGTIQLNTQFNWMVPDAVDVKNITTGRIETFDFQRALGQELGRTFSAPEVSALIMLHEFRHVRGAAQETDRKGFDTDILERCFK
ncbi:MAG: RHS repeat-associated core domain-containing protein, partial [Planctomycetota bacterium]